MILGSGNSYLIDDIEELRKGYQFILNLIGPDGAAHSMDDLMFQIKEIKKIANIGLGRHDQD
jgi:hypothetical protein